MKNAVLRIIAAICFVPSLISGIQSFIYSNTYSSGQVHLMAIALIPAAAAALIIIGSLVRKPVVCAVGAILDMLISVFQVFQFLLILSPELPDAARSNMISSIILNCLMVLGLLFLVLACLVKERAPLFGIVAAAIFIIRFIIVLARGNISKTISGSWLLPVLAIVGFIVGPILISRYVVSKKTAEE